MFSSEVLEKYAMVENESLAHINIAKDLVRKAEGRGSVTIEYYDQFGDAYPDWSQTFNVDM